MKNTKTLLLICSLIVIAILLSRNSCTRINNPSYNYKPDTIIYTKEYIDTIIIKDTIPIVDTFYKEILIPNKNISHTYDLSTATPTKQPLMTFDAFYTDSTGGVAMIMKFDPNVDTIVNLIFEVEHIVDTLFLLSDTTYISRTDTMTIVTEYVAPKEVIKPLIGGGVGYNYLTRQPDLYISGGLMDKQQRSYTVDWNPIQGSVLISIRYPLNLKTKIMAVINGVNFNQVKSEYKELRSA